MPTPPGKTRTSGWRSSANVASAIMPSMPFSLRYSHRALSDEDDVDERDALEHLVGAHGIERGELREEGDGDGQGGGHADVLSWATRAEAAAIGVRGDAEAALGDPPQRFGGAESAAGGDHVERVVGRLELAPGRLQAHALDELAGGFAHFGAEHAGEVAQAHVRRGGEGGNTVVTSGRGLDQCLHGPYGRALGPPHPHRGGELRLARPVDEGTSRASGPPSAPRPRRGPPARGPAPDRCPPSLPRWSSTCRL